ncbi:amino acid permease [Rothia kristinae]|uniref:amino acid permease n=1 Tax=Rothia kristinae TaxID=37923 RepID=UPI0021B66DF8|nr:amino acid permease [Rothia kristinae]
MSHAPENPGAAAPTPAEPAPGQGGLTRSLSHEQMTMIALGSALGTGLFLGSGAAIAIAGPAVIVSYAIGSLIAAIIASAAGEMAVRFPVRGGFGSMAARYLGPFGGFISRWSYWATTVLVAGAELVAVATYLKFWWPELPLWVGIVVFGAIVLGLNAFSVKSFGSVEFILSGIKVLAVIAFIIIGLIIVFFGLPSHPAEGLHRLTEGGGFLPNGPASIWLAMAVVMFSFGGIELVSISAAEAKDPVRSVRSAAKATVWRLSTFYVLSLFVVMCLMSSETLTQEEGLSSSPFVRVFSDVGIPAAAAVINFIVLVAALSAANANVYAGTRLMHSLSYEGMAPRRLRATTARGIPAGALAVSSLGILLVVVLALFTESVFQIMMSMITTLVLVVWGLILVSYISYRRRDGAADQFRLLGGPAMAGVGILGLVAVFVAVFSSAAMVVPGLVAVAFFAVLVVVYFAAVRHHAQLDESAFQEAHDATGSVPTVAPPRRRR